MIKILRITVLKHFTAPFICAAVVTASLFVTVSSVRAQDTSSLSSLLGQLTSTSQASTDSTLKSLGSELATKAQSLGTSLGGGSQRKPSLRAHCNRFSATRGPRAVAEFQKLSAAKLTPDQLSLARDVGHVGSAYLVQKNLGALDGSQSDVATIVSSLRSGNVTAALPAIKKVSQNANLTPDQKDLLSSMAKKLVPGAGSISDGLKSLPGLGH